MRHFIFRAICIIIAMICMTVCVMQAQQPVKQIGKELVAVKDTTKTKVIEKPVLTDMTYKDKHGKTYQVYRTSRGNYYYERIAIKTNKPYKVYLKIDKS